MTDLGVRRLPSLTAAGATQMAIDRGLLQNAEFVTARRYLWSPPALSVGKFQRLAVHGGDVPFDVVRRPSGGRAVLHGEGFEWSFAVVFPPGLRLPAGVRGAYEVVSAAFASALAGAGLPLRAGREQPYRHSALCFRTSLRYDLHAAGGKVVAVAQVQNGGAVLVHGSVLERRPPRQLLAAVETLLGESWRGEGLEGVGAGGDGAALWESALRSLTERLEAREEAVALPRVGAQAR
ncbi:MAG: lipoate--protein ligase family protein [Actinobacteria bacterium]|jgi:lipoate-protein ligase A|nr:lipoate--protein ligase family protein [Actinomycetota bacterium]